MFEININGWYMNNVSLCLKTKEWEQRFQCSLDRTPPNTPNFASNVSPSGFIDTVH